MNKLRSALQALLFVVISLAFTSLAQAQLANRTWVSGVGNDVKPLQSHRSMQDFCRGHRKDTYRRRN